MIRHRQALVYVAACAIAAFAVNAAADNSQQSKMTTCNAEAKSKSLAGDDRKAFMKTCLSAAPAAAPAAPMNSQQQKMKDCNASAKTQSLTGDARKQFMSNCLKGS
jgi:hypothetical protein